ncbi:hypothetical protein F66182_187 [Fusarium sp. NRRL 66182]|nr:hypothetical protein F66182_187 [Fusarium sp. NRRL 66182]
MASASSSSRDVMELFSRRRVTNIPSDQKRILEQSDSWATSLKNQPHGLAHIPGHVLETVKAAYIANKEPPNQATPRSTKRSGSSVASPTSKRMRNAITSTPKKDFQISPEPSSGTPIPWTPSPSRKQIKNPASVAAATASAVQSSIVHETPKPDSTAPPPRRRFIPRVEDLPSSDGSEDELETEIPDALPQNEEPVIRIAVCANPTVASPLSTTNRAMATPPCAQPSNSAEAVIPNTIVTNKEATNKDAKDKEALGEKSPGKGQFRPVNKYKKIEVDVGDKKRKNHNDKQRLAPTRMPPLVNSSIPTSSDPFIPNTYKVSAANQDSIRESIEDNENTDNVEEVIPSTDEQQLAVIDSSDDLAGTVTRPNPSDTNRQTTDKGKQPGKRPTTPSDKHPPKMAPSSNPRKRLSSQKVARKSIPPATLRIGPTSEVEPYEVFIHHYPEYAGNNGGRKQPGTKDQFISACVYLNYLRKRNALRDYLYDDFIRAFPGQYREYRDRAGPSSLVAIEWFNRLKDAPSYDKYLVNRDNLSFILGSYPEEFARASQKITTREGDKLSIYTSSEDGFDPEDEEELSSPIACRSRRMASQQPVATIESDMDLDLPNMPPVQRSSSKKQQLSRPSEPREPSVEPEHVPVAEPTPPLQPSPSRSWAMPRHERPLISSRIAEYLTQLPAPVSPKIPEKSTLPPSSSLATSAIKWRAPRPSQYLNKMPSSTGPSSSAARRSKKERERLRKHFMDKKSKEVNGSKSRGVWSSSGRMG